MEEADIMSMIGQGGDNGASADMSAAAYQNIQSSEGNLIQWQLELDNILERIEHLLKGDVLRLNEQGEMEYVVPENTDLIILNEYGVQLIMNILSCYLNRNTILSNYKEERINEILYDLGNELADLIFINYEKMGLDTVVKKSRANVIIMNLLHMIESAYNRSLKGEERGSLRTARVVTQTQPMGTPGLQPNYPAPRQGGFSMNPFKGFKR